MLSLPWGVRGEDSYKPGRGSSNSTWRHLDLGPLSIQNCEKEVSVLETSPSMAFL